MKTIALFALLLVSGIAIAQPPNPEKYRLLWEITSPHTKEPSYLYGTMHVTDSRVFDMPDSVLIAIQNSAGFALEVDFDSASYLTLEYMYSQHGDAIFDESSWAGNHTRSGGGTQRRPDPADLFKLFDREDQDEEVTFLDAFLYRVAREHGKTLTGLENIVDQLSMLTGEDIDAQPVEEGESPGGGKRLRLSEMIEVYEAGDLERLDQMVNQGGSSKYFKEEVIVRRNYGMAKQADSLIRIRPTFIGVGAAHLPGKEGVLSLLQERGYTLRPVKATYTGLNKVYREKPYQARWIPFKREGDGYSLEVPTRPFGMDILDGQIKMYLGMDFPGGMIYCFYALSLPEEVQADKMDEVGKAIVSSFGSNNIDEDATKDIQHQSLVGKEYVVKKAGEYLRVRILFGNGKMYMLLMGNSKRVIFSEAAEHWFNSLKVFEPVRLTQQTRYPIRDAVNGFSMEFLGEPDHISHHVESFTTGGERNFYDVYENKDLDHRQRMLMLTEDFEDWYAVSRLEGRMPDCIRYYAFGELDPVGEYKRLNTDGVKGLEGTYIGATGLKYRIRCYIRLNRLYLLGTTLPEDDPDSAMVDTVFNSLHFLPIQQPSLNRPVQEVTRFEAQFPGKPNHFSQWNVPSGLTGSVDSMWVHLYHDPSTSLNTQVSVGRIWEYFSGTDSLLLQAAVETSMRDSGTVMLDESRSEGAWNTRRLVLLSYDSTMRDHRHWVVTGDHLVEARIQTTNDAAGEATATRFFQLFRPAPNSAKDAHDTKKLHLIFAEMGAADSLAEFRTTMALGKYRLRPDEYTLAFDSIRVNADTEPFTLDDQLLEMVLEQDDPALLAPLQSLYEFLPTESALRMDIVSSLMLRDWPGAHAWAVERLKDNPSPLSYRDDFFSWYPHLQEDVRKKDSEQTQLRDLVFLLDKPEFALSLASDMARLAMDEEVDYTVYGEKMAAILSQSIDAFDPNNPDNWIQQMEMGNVFGYLVSKDLGDWDVLARRMIALPQSYLPGSAYVALLENDIQPSPKETKKVMESRFSRGEALTWILDNGWISTLPAKYRSPDFIAPVVLDIALEDYPDRVELVEKHKVTYQDTQQWLYIYKFAFEGDADWTLGFSGPFPLNGDPEDSYFALSGSNWENYHPNSYLKKMKAWVRSMEE